MDQNFPQTTKYRGLLQLVLQIDAHAKAFDVFLAADTTYFLLDKCAVVLRTLSYPLSYGFKWKKTWIL